MIITSQLTEDKDIIERISYQYPTAHVHMDLAQILYTDSIYYELQNDIKISFIAHSKLEILSN